VVYQGKGKGQQSLFAHKKIGMKAWNLARSEVRRLGEKGLVLEHGNDRIGRDARGDSTGSIICSNFGANTTGVEIDCLKSKIQFRMGKTG